MRGSTEETKDGAIVRGRFSVRSSADLPDDTDHAPLELLGVASTLIVAEKSTERAGGKS
jgi:hypothetical protein